MDLLSGYHQVPLDKESSMMTCFITPFGTYRFLWAPMVLSPSGERFNIGTDPLSEGLENVLKLVDDVLFQAASPEKLEKKLDKFFAKCREMNVKISEKKCKATTRVKFGGCVLDTSEDADIPNAVPMMGTVKRVRVGEVELRSSRFLEEMAVEAKEDINYQMIMNEVLKDTKKKDIKTTRYEEVNVKLHILQEYKSCVYQLKVVDVGENKLLYKDNKLIPPEEARKNLIILSHQRHLGAQTIYSNMNEVLWWPRMRQDVMREAMKCKQCA